MTKYMVLLICLVLFLAAHVPATLHAQQIPYAKGLDVSPTYDGWEQNTDGSYTMHFGYFNRNTQQEFNIPIGPDNNIDGGDKGQPTHFYTDRKWWVFDVVVPKDWPKDKRVVWTLTTNGRTNQAKGWLQEEWEVDKGVIAKNAARDPSLMTAGTNERDIDHQNVAPKIAPIAPQTVNLADTLTVAATATDDGRPKPASANTTQEGLRLRWIHYRGPANVRFDPDIMPTRAYGKPATLETKVKFTEPGEYILRVIASDGELVTTYDVPVTVRR
jgi:hypothetical protein